MQMMRKAVTGLLGATIVLGVCATPAALAQDSGSGMTTIIPTDKQWEKNKVMPYGMKVLNIYGDPSKPGPYMFRLRVPTGYKWPPLKYPDERVTTIIKGTLWAGEGERYDPMKMKELEAGSMFITGANTAHYQWARTEVILQVIGTGPIDNPVTYVNADDDPREH
jgi:hypothetical protein